jgi:serine/threonine-protein kinase
MNDAPSQELVGRTLGGRFRLTGFLGEGAMASVYRGEQDAEPKDVAIKVMHPELLRDDTFAKRFHREAKTAAMIEHRNTVRILEQGEEGDLLYLAMELLVGQDLFDTLVRERRLPEARAARIGMQICAALQAAHELGVVHRDLKPENVMLVRDPEDPEADLVKVLDFGIAKILERERTRGGLDEAPPSSGPMSGPPSSVLTRVGSLVGTPDYMSPEQCIGQPVDARSDVYACGVLMFQLVTGKVPFVGGSPIDVMMQHCDKPPPAPSSLLPGIHPRLEKLILRAMAKAAEDRPQSARAMGEELASLLADLSATSRRVPPAPGSGPKAADLPGLPSAVVISAERAPALRESKPEREESPVTMRSPAADRSEAFASTIEATPEEVAAARAPVVKVAFGDVEPAVVAPAEAASQKPATPAEVEAIAAAAKPAPPRRPAPPADLAPVEQAGSDAMPWIFAIFTLVVCVLLWLVRYLRFR